MKAKKITFILFMSLCCIMQFTVYGQKNKVQAAIDPYSPDPNPVRTLPGWQYVWGDEFNKAGAVDTTLWHFEEGYIRGNEAQYYQKDNATVANGRLLISGRKEAVLNKFYDPNSTDYRRNTQYSTYTSASINGKSKRYFLFGRIEVRAKIDASNGAFPAIWTTGFNKNWPQNGEIDMMEYYLTSGKPVFTSNFCAGGDLSTDVYAQNWKSVFTDKSYYEAKDPDWINKYHIFRMDWTEDAINLYVDDELRNSINIYDFTNFDGSICFYNPQFMMLDLAMKDFGNGIADNIKFEVDYFRVYQQVVDTEKPSVVTGLTASNIKGSSCDLTWNSSSDNEGVYRYDVYQGGIGDNNFITSTVDTTLNITDLPSGAAIQFYVLALDYAGNYSVISAPLTVKTIKTVTLSSGGAYVIKNVKSSKVISSLNGSSTPGTNLCQVAYTATGAAADLQKWIFTDSGKGYWNIKNKANGLSMDVSGWLTTSGSNICEWTFGDASNQQWKIESPYGTYYTITSNYSSKLLAIKDAAITANAELVQMSASGGTEQQWTIYDPNASAVESVGYNPINLYPNPAKDYVYCSLNQLSGESELSISNTSGQQIFKGEIENTSNVKLDISFFPAGLYVVHIKSNGQNFIGKILKQ